MTSSARDAGTVTPRRGQLALIFQEPLTAAVRLRANRQVAAEAASFRSHLKELLAGVDVEARRAGYPGADISYALFAYVAFLDEAVLNSNQPMFAEWHRRPLQEEVFGGHIGGELFFQQLRELLSRQDSAELADILEVFQLCLLLGFSGRYRGSESGELHGLLRLLGERIDRIRGPLGPLSPSGTPKTGEALPRSRDPWLRRLAIMAGIMLGLTAALFAGLSLWLNRAVRVVIQAVQGMPS